MNSDPASVHDLTGYWESRATAKDGDSDKIDCMPRTQRIRFEAFLANHNLTGCSVLDVGCGVGDFWGRLVRRGIHCDYLGVDLSAEMVRRSAERFSGVRFQEANILEWDRPKSFDYTVSFGIHNILLPDVDMTAILEQVTRRQFELCRIATHISILTDRFEGFGSHIRCWRAEQVLSLALSITPYVSLGHHYLPHDFCLTLYREPIADTRPELSRE